MGFGITKNLILSSLLSEANTSPIITHIVYVYVFCYIHANDKSHSYKIGAIYQMTNYKGRCPASLTAKHETPHWTSYSALHQPLTRRQELFSIAPFISRNWKSELFLCLVLSPHLCVLNILLRSGIGFLHLCLN